MDYDVFKEEVAQKLLETLYQQVPQLKGKVDYYELSTPLSTAHFSNYQHGELYGLSHTPERFQQSWIKPKLPIEGLYLTGQDVLFCGVASALAAGVLTASTMLGSQMIKVLPEFFASTAPLSRKWQRSVPIPVPPQAQPRAQIPAILNAKCVEVLEVTHDVKAFRWVPEVGTPLVYQPGQFMTLVLELEGKKVYRSYTISSSPTRPEYFELTVKRVPQGLVSNWLCDEMQAGMSFRMTGPYGQFSCQNGAASKLLLLSAGSGITPMLSMSRWLLEQDLPCDIVFFHSARTPEDIIFYEELQHLQQQHAHFQLKLSITRKTPRTSWQGLTGYLTGEMLQKISPDFQEREIYICGPQGFMENTKAFLQQSHFPMERYHQESFGTPAAALSAAGGWVYFAESGQAVSCDGKSTILQVADQAGISIPSACRTGVCGECKVLRMEGEVLTDGTEGLDPDEVRQGYVLTCVGCVNGKVVLAA